MSIPVTDVIQLPPIATVAGSYPVTIPVSISDNWANDDWVFLVVSFGVTSGSATLSTASSGWTEVEENGITNGAKMAIYKAKVAGGTVADPTIAASTGTGMWQGFMWVERGLDGTTPVLSTAKAAAGSTVNTLTTGTLTPANNNAHVYYFAAVCTTSLIYTRFLDSEIVGEALQSLDNGTTQQTVAVGSWQQGTAASTVKTLYASAVGRLGCITMALNDAVTTQRAQHASVDMTRIAWGGTFGNQHDGSLTPTVSAWNGNPTSRTIDGVAVSTTGGTVDLTSTSNTSNNEWGFYTAFASTLNADNWQGNLITFAADVDLSGGIFSVEFAPVAVNNTIGTKGWIIVFENNAGTEWAAFRLSSKVGLKPGKSYTIMVDLENAVPYSSELGDGVQSAIDWTTVRKITPLVHRSGLGATSRTFLLKNFLLWRSVELTGGSSDLPQNINYLRKAMQGWGYDGLVGGESPAATLRCDTFIGDGTIPTYYDATGTLHGFPVAYDFISSREVNIPANALTLTIKASASDTVNMTATSISAPVQQNLVYDATSSGAAVYSTVGAAVSNMATTLLAGETYTGATWAGSGTVNCESAALSGCTITGTTSANTAASWDANPVAAITDCTIDGTGAAYAIELGTAVTAITLTDCTITAGSTDKVHVLKTLTTVTDGSFVVGVHYRINTVGSGTDWTAIGGAPGTVGTNFTATGVGGAGTGTADQAVKITISGTTSLAEADCTTAGAPAWVAAPAITQVVVVSGLTAGSRIQIYDTTSSTELFNGTASAGNTVVSGSTATWTDPLAASASRAIRVRVAYVSGVTAKLWQENTGLTCGVTSGTESITYPITQVADTTYNSNAIDGPAIYATSGITFTDAATDLVNINIAADTVALKTIYACFVYWLFTAAGIDDDVAYIDGVDPANYILTSMKIRNTSTDPLKITGGYFYDSTGSVENCVDVAGSSGNIYPMPEHVVPYQTTGTYAITGSLQDALDAIADVPADVLAAAAATPIHSDIRKVNGYTIDGDGQDATPWGPA